METPFVGQALQTYRDHASEIDLAVVDFTMPGRDGVQLIHAMREWTPALPVILMSGHLDRDGRGGPQVDAVFLSKPFRPDQLAATVRKTLDRPSPPAGPGLSEADSA